MSRPLPRSDDLRIIDLAKAVALLFIVCDHVVEQFFGGAFFFNPAPNWPPFGDQIAQLLAPAGPGFAGILGAVVRDVAWLGDEAVGLFLVLSGFGLAWGITRAGNLDLRSFVVRRLGRICPMWLTAHLIIALPLVIIGRVSFIVAIVSAIGIRFLPATYFAIVPAWWYVGLLLQLYAIVPVLWWACRRFGAGRMILAAVLIGLAVRGIGWNFVGPYLDSWSRGAIFITRLPEFAFGFGLAVLCQADAPRFAAFIAAPRILGVAAAAFAIGNVAAMTSGGMILAPLLTSFGGFVLICAALVRVRLPALEWVGKHSYSLYLTHQFTVLLFVRHSHSPLQGALRVLLALASGVGLALVLEWLTPLLERCFAALGVRRFAAVGAALIAVVYGGEWAVRTFDPQEAYGAGERPSLVADPLVTYKLAPNSRTHLRWQTYDYTVQANSLGFPGPEPAAQKRPGVTSVMLLGNAFSSAEGVNTRDSWPRLLERKDPRFSVADFAITGHGPNQWAEIVHTYGQRYRPDLIVVQMWVKDFNDALIEDEAFRTSVGFGLPSATTPIAFLQLVETRAWLHIRLRDPLVSRLHKLPNPEGYGLGGFQYFLRTDAMTVENAGYKKTLTDVKQIRDKATTWGGRVIVVMFPASIQVCEPRELAYYPRYVDFNDAAHFDPNRPQRLAARLAADLHLDYIDMRDAFRPGNCNFAPHNMHLTASGQHLASDYLSRRLAPMLPRRRSVRITSLSRKDRPPRV